MKRFRDRPKRRDATRTSARGTGRGGSCECENFLERLSPRLRLFPHYGPHRMEHGGEIANPFLPLGRGQFRLLADEEGSDGSRCYGNRRKASPGIVRNNYPALNSARSRALRILLFFPPSLSLSLSLPLSLSLSLSLSGSLFVLSFFPSPGEVANRLRG